MCYILTTEQDVKLFSRLQHVYEDRVVNLNVFICNSWLGNIVAKEGQNIHWQQFKEICNLIPQLPTTIKIIKLLNNR